METIADSSQVNEIKNEKNTGKAVAMKKESKVWEIESGVLLNVRGFLFCGVYNSVGAGPGGHPRMNSDLIEIVHLLMKNVESWILV